jgi:hypothetical protein
MSVRTVGASPLYRIPRLAYHWVGAATAPLRLQPAFVMIGAQRCGTTSLFRALAGHPQVMSPAFRKGINYFDLNYFRGERWYTGHFPISEIARRHTSGYGERMARDLPAAKLVAMLRDPVERAFSAYKHEQARGYEQEGFERALELEDERLAGEIGRMRDDPRYESFSHRHHSYVHRGHYAEQLERAFGLFSRSQVHIIDSEAYFGQPEQEYRRLLAFLGLHPFQPPAGFGQHNARPSAAMPDATRRMLASHYAPYDEKLAQLLGRPLSWNH